MNKTIYTLLLSLGLTGGHAVAQNIDLAHLKNLFGKGNPLKINGGVSASTILYNGNDGSGRAPFAWFINGNLNLNILGQVNLPFSFNFTNTGSGYSYPTVPNRLSLHPSYKWVTGHIGDVSMTFSPYTLSGYQFTGLGVDLTPEGPFKFSAMYGRLQRAVEMDTVNHTTQAAYRRMGYGAKITYQQPLYTLGMIVFAAKDDSGSLRYKPDSLQIYPQQNLVISWNGAIKPAKGMILSAEYATSALTRDIRDTTAHAAGSGYFLQHLMPARNSTSYYKAVKLQLNYTFLKNLIGVGYERVDPGYTTLGAYYFTNDLENITVNIARPFFRNKANIAANVGWQRDNLDNSKSGTNHRLVSSVNLSFNPSRRLSTSLSYSNFQTYMNIRPQFAYINQLTQYQNLDTLNYTQLSQNANLNLNYMMNNDKRRSQSVNLNLSFQDAYDQQGGVVSAGNSSLFYNMALSYNILFVPQSVSLTTAFNGSYNAIGRNGYTTLGPTLALNSKLLKKKLIAGFTTSYNTSNGSGSPQSSVFNIRWSTAYAIRKRQHLGLDVVQQYRNVTNQAATHSIVATLGYNYSF